MFVLSLFFYLWISVGSAIVAADYNELLAPFRRSDVPDANLTFTESEYDIFGRATGPSPVTASTFTSTYPFVLSVQTPTTQGLGVIINVRWALTVYPLVSAYLTGANTRKIKIKSGSINVAAGSGKIHRVTSIIPFRTPTPTAADLTNQVNLLVLCRTCPDLPNSPVNRPQTNWPNAGITGATVLRWYDNLSALQYQTVTLIRKTDTACSATPGFTSARQECSENLFMTAVDYGAPFLDNSTPKKLIGLAVHISNANNAAVAEIYDDVGTNVYNSWIVSTAV